MIDGIDRRSAGPGATAIDLFCGAGGLSLGLKMAGFDVKLGVDFDEHALSTYTTNFPERTLRADVRTLSGKDLLAAAGTRHVDLLAGGPSCQGFSTHGKRQPDDERNFLYREFMRLVGEIQPTLVLMENVKGMVITRDGAFLRSVLRSFYRFGYQVTYGTLLAAGFGVPQLRERIFFLASKLDAALSLPTPQYINSDALLVESGSDLLPFVTVEAAIADLPQPTFDPYATVSYAGSPESAYAKFMRKGASRWLYNHVAKPVSAHAERIIRHIPMGYGVRALPARVLPERFKKMRRISNGKLRRDCTTLYHRLSLDRPAYTITCYFTNVSAGAFTHPLENRALTPREAARLQSFPDSFRFMGAKIPHQIGNAVPPLLARAVGLQLMRHIRRSSGTKVA